MIKFIKIHGDLNKCKRYSTPMYKNTQYWKHTDDTTFSGYIITYEI